MCKTCFYISLCILSNFEPSFWYLFVYLDIKSKLSEPGMPKEDWRSSLKVSGLTDTPKTNCASCLRYSTKGG